MHRLKQIFYVWVALLLYPLHASVVVPGDVPYSSVEQGQTLYIFSDNTREFINQLAAYNEAIRRRYDKSYSWRLDQRMDLILTSPRQQVANAYATIIPNVKTVWYPSGAAMLEEMAESSWLLTLAAHETAHLYQINAKGEVPAALTKVLGNSVTFVPFIWPVFLHPNLFTPTFLVEGNAVLMESRLNMGGRLHSGEKRALVLAQIQAGLINSNRLLNDDFRFPFGEESYLQGGYFQAHLAAKHGVDKTNAFFVKQGERWLWPLILNNTFREHFGASYAQEIREYVRGLEPLALKQQRSAGTSLLQTTYTSPLNHDAEKIFFLATKGKAPPVLHVFNKAAKQFDRQEQLDLFLGKVFFIDGKPHTSAAHQHDLHHIEYSLYAPGARFNPGFRSQIVTDRRGGKTAALDPANSWLENRVLVNGENFDISHSSPILDDAGRVYYFRQNGSERILYRDREPVFKYDGFYGKALEVTSDGSFHFIANTDYGSSLFRFKDGEVTRLLASDRIVDARALNENEYLVVEVNADGHQVLVARSSPQAQRPAVYSYGFASESLIPDPAVDSATLKKVERDYNSLRELRYSALTVGAGHDGTNGLSVNAVADFSDPMEWQSLSLATYYTANSDREYFARYAFTKYLPDFFLSYLVQEDHWPATSWYADKISNDQQAIAGAVIPVWRWRRWNAALTLAATYENEDFNRISLLTAEPLERDLETYGSLLAVDLRYQLAPALAFHPWREFTLRAINRLESETGTFTKRFNTSMIQSRYLHGFPQEFHASLTGTMAWSEESDVDVEYNPYSLSQDISVPRMAVFGDEFTARTVGSVRLEVSKTFATPAYFTRIPLGLNRVAPLVAAQAMFLDDDPLDRYRPHIFEAGYGVDVEVLLLHKFSAQIRLLSAFDVREPDRHSDEVYFQLKREF